MARGRWAGRIAGGARADGFCSPIASSGANPVLSGYLCSGGPRASLHVEFTAGRSDARGGSFPTPAGEESPYVL